ncbi:MAG: DUF4349 domain-containing protein [Rickettsiales bacterium]|jgi:hypothetical protein|nr:DUF4349 domain-containing protein [Rickettsiales bacterium]
MIKRFLICALCAVLSGCGGRQAPSEAAAHAGGPETAERMVSHEVSANVKVGDIDKSKEKIRIKAGELKGYVSFESKENITVRIPADKMDGFLDFLGGDVGTIKDMNKRATDITDSYIDIDSRLAVLTASRSKYMALLKKAPNVDDALKIERELERVNTEIQNLEMRKKRTLGNVNYAGISVSLDDRTFFDYAGRVLGVMGIVAVEIIFIAGLIALF